MTVARIAGLGVLALVGLALPACLGGGDAFRYGPTPEGWPAPTPVGQVEVKTYPAYREAWVDARDGRSGGRPLFRELSHYIRANDIDMRAPVEMRFREGDEEAGLVSMAFVYGSADEGEVGTKGPVRVRDEASRRYASIGVRGSYDERSFERGLSFLEAWIQAESSDWKVAGEPRYLAYDRGLVPGFLRYGEVQVPVKSRH